MLLCISLVLEELAEITTLSIFLVLAVAIDAK